MDGHEHPNRSAPGPAPADPEIEAALNDFIKRSMHLPSDAICVEYSSGIATLSGSVGSVSRARAIEDLVRCHERVDSVVSRLSAGVVPAARGTAR